MHKQGNARGRAWYADLRFLLLIPVALLAVAWFTERQKGHWRKLLDRLWNGAVRLFARGAAAVGRRMNGSPDRIGLP